MAAPDPARRLPLRVLFVADTSYWITAKIARRIWRFNPWIEPGLLSASGLNHVLHHSGGAFPVGVDLVHFMTPHLATQYRDRFRDGAPFVACIHHIEDAASVEPAGSADAIMAICDQWRDVMVAQGVPADRIGMIRMAVDPALFRPPAAGEKARLRARYGIGPSTFCVGFSGKASSDTQGRKGIDCFKAAAELLAARHPDSAFLVMGPGWAKVAEDFRRRGVRLIYLPFMLEDREVAEFYRMLDLYWVTSRIEGGPVPMLEAMSSGVPCVSTPVGHAPQAVIEGENGFMAPFDAPEVFAEIAAGLVGDPARLARLGEAARATSIARFPQDETVAPTGALYDVAFDSFRRRAGTPAATPRGVAWRDGELSDLPKDLRRSLAIRENLQFIDSLLQTGAGEPARRVAMRALRAAPFDRATWRAALSAFPAIGRSVKAIRRTAGPARP